MRASEQVEERRDGEMNTELLLQQRERRRMDEQFLTAEFVVSLFTTLLQQQ